MATLWYQDAPYYGVAGEQSVSFRTPRNALSRAVPLECIPGSQRWNRCRFRPLRFDGTPLHADGGFEELPDIDARCDQLPVRACAPEPGAAFACYLGTVCGAPANVWTIVRRVLAPRHG